MLLKISNCTVYVYMCVYDLWTSGRSYWRKPWRPVHPLLCGTARLSSPGLRCANCSLGRGSSIIQPFNWTWGYQLRFNLVRLKELFLNLLCYFSSIRYEWNALMCVKNNSLWGIGVAFISFLVCSTVATNCVFLLLWNFDSNFYEFLSTCKHGTCPAWICGSILILWTHV